MYPLRSLHLMSFHWKLPGYISTQFSIKLTSFGSPEYQLRKVTGLPSLQVYPASTARSFKPEKWKNA